MPQNIHDLDSLLVRVFGRFRLEADSNNSKLGGCRLSGASLNALVIRGSRLRFRKTISSTCIYIVIRLGYHGCSWSVLIFTYFFYIFVDLKAFSNMCENLFLINSLIISRG